MNRDDFPTSVVDRLRKQVADRCSNPQCRKVTGGPGPDDASVSSIGLGAHIRAAAPGGPRYDTSMTREQRRHSSNGIWLCNNCSREVDNDPITYTVELLHEWKRTALALARAERGKRPLENADVVQQMSTVLGASPAQFLPVAINNVHAAASTSLQALDPRFDVQSEYRNGRTAFVLRANETVPFSIQVDPLQVSEWRSKLRDLVDHGRPAHMVEQNLRITGSPLFERLFSAGTRTTVSLVPNARAAVGRLVATDPSSQESFTFDEFRGFLVAGAKTFSFSGTACNGLVELEVSHPLGVSGSPDSAFSLGFNDLSWRELQLSRLPYFDRIHRLFDLVQTGWHVDLRVEMEGQPILGAHLHLPSDNPALLGAATLLDYTDRARRLARHIENASLFYRSQVPFTQEDHLALDEAVRTFEGERVYRQVHLTAPITSHIVAQAQAANLRALVDNEHEPPHLLSFQSRDTGMLTVFGQEVQLPPLEIELENVRAGIEVDLAEVREGDAVLVTWEPCEEFRASFRYLLGVIAGQSEGSSPPGAPSPEMQP